MPISNKSEQSVGSFRRINYTYAGIVTSDTITTTGVGTIKRTISGVYTVNGNKRDPNPHRYTIVSSRAFNGTRIEFFLGTSRPRYTIEGWHTNLSMQVLHLSPSNFAYNMALSDFNEKVRGSLDLSIDLAQWKQVSDMINIRKRGIESLAKKLNSIGGAIDKLDRNSRRRIRRRANGKGPGRDIRMNDNQQWYDKRARKLARYIAEKRLEYVYGWMPLASTITDLGKEFCQPKKFGAMYLTGTGKDVASGITTINANTKREHRYSQRARIKCLIAPLEKTRLDQLARITSLNPASIAWELTPFSFVVDWFVDVGGWIRSTETAYTHGHTFVSGYVTRTTRSENLFRTYGFKQPALFEEMEAYSRKVTMNRSLLTSYPTPSRPVFRPVLTASRLLNAAALLAVNATRIDRFVNKYR
jgi:hypothetical protein